MKFVFAVLVVIAGIFTSMQTGMNAQLRHSLGHAATAALANFSIGLVAIIASIFVFRIPFPSLAAVGQTPVWAWFGGLFGAFLIGTLAFAARELGGAMIVALLVGGQLFAALILDHYGWLGFPVRPVTLSRILGSVLLVTSLVLFKES